MGNIHPTRYILVVNNSNCSDFYKRKPQELSQDGAIPANVRYDMTQA